MCSLGGALYDWGSGKKNIIPRLSGEEYYPKIIKTFNQISSFNGLFTSAQRGLYYTYNIIWE